MGEKKTPEAAPHTERPWWHSSYAWNELYCTLTRGSRDGLALSQANKFTLRLSKDKELDCSLAEVCRFCPFFNVPWEIIKIDININMNVNINIMY